MFKEEKNIKWIDVDNSSVELDVMKHLVKKENLTGILLKEITKEYVNTEMRCNYRDCVKPSCVRFSVFDKNFKPVLDKTNKVYCLEHDEIYATFLRTCGYFFIRHFSTDKW